MAITKAVKVVFIAKTLLPGFNTHREIKSHIPVRKRILRSLLTTPKAEIIEKVITRAPEM
jgi:hypothetical protein